MSLPGAEEIVQLETVELRAWLLNHDTAPDFNWLGLAEVAAAEALALDVEDERRCALADVALLAYRKAQTLSPGSALSTAAPEALLRAELILRLGAGSGVQRPEELWEVVATELPVGEVRRLVAIGAPSVVDTDRADLLRLRRVKNVLRAIERLVLSERIVLPREVKWWWERRDRLP